MRHLKYFNSINEFLTTESIVDRINMLLNKGICYVSSENIIPFEKELKEHDSKLNDDIDFICNLKYLDFSSEVKKELINTLRELLYLNDKKRTMSFYGSDLRASFSSKLLLCHNSKSRKKLIKKYMKKALKHINNVVDFELGCLFEVSENLNKDTLDLMLDHYYEHALYPNEAIVRQKYDCGEDLDLINRDKVIKDILNHVASPYTDVNILVYEHGYNFFEIQDMLNLIEELKKELIKIDCATSKNAGVPKSEYNVQNVRDKKNRHPLLFKNAYGCELFLYVLGHYDLKKPIIFWYFYDIFRTYKYVSKAKKPKPFIDFINEIYGLTEDRVRRE